MKVTYFIATPRLSCHTIAAGTDDLTGFNHACYRPCRLAGNWVRLRALPYATKTRACALCARDELVASRGSFRPMGSAAVGAPMGMTRPPLLAPPAAPTGRATEPLARPRRAKRLATRTVGAATRRKRSNARAGHSSGLRRSPLPAPATSRLYRGRSEGGGLPVVERAGRRGRSGSVHHLHRTGRLGRRQRSTYNSSLASP